MSLERVGIPNTQHDIDDWASVLLDAMLEERLSVEAFEEAIRDCLATT